MNNKPAKPAKPGYEHYWRTESRQLFALKAAKELERKRKDRERQRYLYDERKKIQLRNINRKKAGIPIDAPLMIVRKSRLDSAK